MSAMPSRPGHARPSPLETPKICFASTTCAGSANSRQNPSFERQIERRQPLIWADNARPLDRPPIRRVAQEAFQGNDRSAAPRPKVGRKRANFGRRRTTRRAQNGAKQWSTPGQNWGGRHRSRPANGQIWLTQGRSWPKLVEPGATSVQVSPNAPEVGPTLATFGRSRPDVGRHGPGVGRVRTEGGPDVGRIQPPKSVELGSD